MSNLKNLLFVCGKITEGIGVRIIFDHSDIIRYFDCVKANIKMNYKDSISNLNELFNICYRVLCINCTGCHREIFDRADTFNGICLSGLNNGLSEDEVFSIVAHVASNSRCANPVLLAEIQKEISLRVEQKIKNAISSQGADVYPSDFMNDKAKSNYIPVNDMGSIKKVNPVYINNRAIDNRPIDNRVNPEFVNSDSTNDVSTGKSQVDEIIYLGIGLYKLHKLAIENGWIVDMAKLLMQFEGMARNSAQNKKVSLDALDIFFSKVIQVILSENLLSTDINVYKKRLRDIAAEFNDDTLEIIGNMLIKLGVGNDKHRDIIASQLLYNLGIIKNNEAMKYKAAQLAKRAGGNKVRFKAGPETFIPSGEGGKGKYASMLELATKGNG